jgi:hypothetical protein
VQIAWPVAHLTVTPHACSTARTAACLSERSRSDNQLSGMVVLGTEACTVLRTSARPGMFRTRRRGRLVASKVAPMLMASSAQVMRCKLSTVSRGRAASRRRCSTPRPCVHPQGLHCCHTADSLCKNCQNCWQLPHCSLSSLSDAKSLPMCYRDVRLVAVSVHSQPCI